MSHALPLSTLDADEIAELRATVRDVAAEAGYPAGVRELEGSPTGLDADLSARLHATVWYRSDSAEGSFTQFSQEAISAYARADYRLRLLKLALEYRRSRNLFSYPGVASNNFAGHQLRFSVSRPFGGRL